MDNKEIVKHLSDLIQLDVDAVEAYQQALKNIDIPDIYNKIKSFQNDHIEHINNLSGIMRSLGEKPPERTKDIKGFIIKGFTAIRSATGTKGALKAMETNEILTNTQYSNATKLELPEVIMRIVNKNYEDEKRHLAYIRQILESGELK